MSTHAARRAVSVLGRWRDFLDLPLAVRRRFVVMVVPWLVAFVLGIPLLWWQFKEMAEAPLWRVRDSVLDESAEIVRRTLDSLEHDVLFLGDLTPQLPHTSLEANSPMGRLFVTFAKTNSAYDQVRWLDPTGRENLRVDNRDGNPLLASAAQLQDKSTRPYYMDAANVSPGTIYFSEIDLNVEHGIVERPFVPTLRVATPLYEHGARNGVIVINYRATRLFERLNGLADRQGLGLALLNDKGYWLQGLTPADDWAWQLDAPDHTVARSNPALWQAIQSSRSGHFSDETGEWAFRNIKLTADGIDMDTAGAIISRLGLTILVHSPPGDAARAGRSWEWLLAPIIALILFLATRYAWQTVKSLVEEERRTKDVQDANRALRRANDNLVSVQAELSRAERLSSLGLMVAGVAHELNTPLGSASLALSTLLQSVGTLRQRADEGLRRSDLSAFLEDARQAAGLADSAVRRASGLVQRFKQVAVDRTTMERRTFDLAEVVLDADPRLRKWDIDQPITLRLDLQPGLQMNSYPGPLEQVVTNLLTNALTHAFNGKDGGSIVVQAHADGAFHVVLRVIDDGVGIDADALPHIFDPFFTTHRHAGGTGLGLHIASQLVVEVLGGTISARSRTAEGGTGTAFLLRLPREAPISVATA
jgi:signal transduction histidine kinase